MNKRLQQLIQLICKDGSMTSAQKKEAVQALKVVEKELNAALLKSSSNETKNKTGALLKKALIDLELKRKEVAAKDRELAIESALDRVRSRSMEMHASHELIEVVRLLSKEVRDLGIHVEATQLVTDFSDPKKGFNIWIAVEGIPILRKFHVPRFDIPLVKNFFRAIKRRRAFYTEKYSRAEKNWLYKFLYKNSDFKFIPKERQKVTIDIPAGVIRSSAINKNSVVTFQRFGSEAYSEEENAILKRFGTAFEQSYTRFLDLQKAEAQAREAQIEVALERVRARSMAMHQSDELSDCAELLFRELSTLGGSLWTCGFAILKDDDNAEGEYRTTDSGGTREDVTFIPNKGDPTMQFLYEGWKHGKTYLKCDLGGKEIKAHYKNMLALPRGGHVFQAVLDAGSSFPHWQQMHAAYFKHGYLLVISVDNYNESGLLVRFAKVFEQTYTRFLDLQKAEAQAREAEIQLGLERLRAKTMAMHKSEELLSMASILFDQFRQLQKGNNPENIDRCAMALLNKKEKRFDLWITQTGGTQSNQKYWFDFSEPTHGKPLYKIFQQKKNQHVIDLKGKQLAKWLDYLKTVGVKISPELYKRRRINTNTRFSSGFIVVTSEEPLSNENLNLINRFAKVFEQTYTRFLDLQKAEAQAREAEIQLALERIRASAMAMQSSKDLETVASVLREQMANLGEKTLESCLIHIYNNDDTYTAWYAFRSTENATSDLVIDTAIIPWKEAAWSRQAMANYRKGTKQFLIEADRAMLKEWYNVLARVSPRTVEYNANGEIILPDRLLYYFSNFAGGSLVLITGDQATPEARTLLDRAAKNFELAYRRFEDLKKAEAQAREAQIEASLERVRAKAMAMHSSQDLVDTINVFYHQMASLSVMPIRCGIGIADKETQSAELSTMNTIEQQNSIEVIGNLHMLGHPVLEEIFEHWLTQTEYHPVLRDKEIDKYYDLMRTEVAFPRDPNDPIQFGHFFYFSEGWVYAWTNAELNEDELRIYRRFTSVLSLTYKRFKDLKQAEAQAREAQIEAALERVRARTMAMQRSEELNEAASLLFQQVQSLGAPSWTAGYCIFDEDKSAVTLWVCGPWGDIQPSFRVPLDENPSFINYLEAHNKGLELYIEENSAKVNEENYQYLLTLPVVGERLKSIIAKGLQLPTYQVDHCAYFSKGFLLFITYQQVSELHSVFKRFAAVFDQTYTRFLDLQKAETQAREAQIEAALERVRSRSMGMQKSEELHKINWEVRQQIEQLDIHLFAFGIHICHENEPISEAWMGDAIEGQMPQVTYDHSSDPFSVKMYKGWKEKETLVVETIQGKKLAEHFKYMMSIVPDRSIFEKMVQPKQLVYHFAYFAHGFFIFVTLEDCVQEHSVFTRFAKVFEQTYTRFLDLKKAEAQAREAQIEAALERVRAKAMAMHSSQDLADTIGTFYTQLKLFNLVPRRCGVGLLNKHNKVGEVFTWNTTENGESLELVGKIRMDSHPILENVYSNWITQTEYHPVLRGNEIREYYQVLRPQVAFPTYQSDEVHYGYFFMFEEGGVYAWKETPLKGDELTIYRRFTSVLSLTYKRYKDLRDAEARAKEAVKQATLDRVRAEIASMRTVNDLDRITPLIWRELTTLGIPFVRCGVFIMDDSLRQINTFLSTPEGRAIAAFHLPYDGPGRTSEILSNWMNKQEYIEHWDETAFSELGDLLVQQGALPSKDVYMQTVPQGGIHLHCLPFLQGMLYVGNTEKLKADDIQLIQAVADAFSTAYARYEDFNKLEAAKKQVDKTLTDLKQAQQQLVQSEKMASLGELTAGIAHEIQNPLNFVNNFSELNKELLTEMEEAIQQKDFDEVTAIARNIVNNQEKINLHGKRAEGIVKGMLQHSRSSSGQKELTDINALCDEYLRLSYHGYRAKDKSFNAGLKTDFDSTLPKINVVPQDFGRVVLNLINNAFYAVSEKSKLSNSGFEPQVVVGTKNLGDKIEIIVKDNGNGIPDSIKEKIFQPFFTTKPTGQGTGLGLSLSYDIVKAHGGELKVTTQDGSGSEFIITLPT